MFGFALIDWDDGYTNDIPMGNIQEERKAFHLYKVGERVQAICPGPGHKGKHWGAIAASAIESIIIDSKLVSSGLMFRIIYLIICHFNVIVFPLWYLALINLFRSRNMRVRLSVFHNS